MGFRLRALSSLPFAFISLKTRLGYGDWYSSVEVKAGLQAHYKTPFS
jgi:hypothetical protein